MRKSLTAIEAENQRNMYLDIARANRRAKPLNNRFVCELCDKNLPAIAKTRYVDAETGKTHTVCRMCLAELNEE